jgi:uncharacterized protein
VTLLYNIVMLAVDLAAIRLIGRRRGLLAWLGAMIGAGAAAVLLGGILGILGENVFGVIRLWSYGVFLHGTALLAATAAALFSRRGTVAPGCVRSPMTAEGGCPTYGYEGGCPTYGYEGGCPTYGYWRRLLALGAALAAVALLLVAADAFLIEPHWLEVSHRRITSPKIHHRVRIVVLADLQCNELGEYERAALRRAVAEKPDVLLLAGDYVEVPWPQYETFQRELHDFLREIGLGSHEKVFAVGGNVDSSDWPGIFEGLNVTAVAARQTFDLGDLRLTCLDLADSGDRSLAVANPAPGRFHLVLGHRPDFALGTIEADLLVAGHTHGGQVRLPWIGPLMTLSRVPRGWAAGLTELSGGGKLLVSRGIGMERGYAPPLRFLCRPELVVIDLVPEGPEDASQDVKGEGRRGRGEGR